MLTWGAEFGNSPHHADSATYGGNFFERMLRFYPWLLNEIQFTDYHETWPLVVSSQPADPL